MAVIQIYVPGKEADEFKRNIDAVGEYLVDSGAKSLRDSKGMINRSAVIHFLIRQMTLEMELVTFEAQS